MLRSKPNLVMSGRHVAVPVVITCMVSNSTYYVAPVYMLSVPPVKGVASVLH